MRPLLHDYFGGVISGSHRVAAERLFSFLAVYGEAEAVFFQKAQPESTTESL
jgi:hypothetical protein